MTKKVEGMPAFHTDLEKANRANERLIRAARRKIREIAPNDVDRAAKIAAILASVSTGPNLGTTHFVDRDSGALITNDPSENAVQKYVDARTEQLDRDIEDAVSDRYADNSEEIAELKEAKKALAAIAPRLTVTALPEKEPAAPKKKKAQVRETSKTETKEKPALTIPTEGKRGPWELDYFTSEELEAAPAALLAFLKNAATSKAQRRSVNRLMCLLGYRCSTSNRDAVRAAIKESASATAGLLRFAARNVRLSFERNQMSVSVKDRGAMVYPIPSEREAALLETLNQISAAM